MTESGEEVMEPETSSESNVEPDVFDIEQEWARARVEAGKPADPFDYPTHGYEFAPILLLYLGLFLGPFGPFAFTLLLLKRLTPLRGALVIGSVAIAAWLLLQGSTWVFQEEWTTFQLQLTRSVCNFGAGLAAYLVVRRATRKSHIMTKGTIFNTAIALSVVVVVSFIVPRPWLMVLGR